VCVAAIINKPLSREHLQCMDDDNPHGGGVAWLQNGRIAFRRGLTASQIYAMQECGVLTFPYLLHFRWATHGSRTMKLTHPFPTGARAFDGELRGEADEVLIHNGVWHDYRHWEPIIGPEVPYWKLDDISDTAVAAYFYAWFPEIADEIPWAVASAKVVDGAMAIKKHGGWSEHEGNEFSNLQWLPWREWSSFSSAGRTWRKDASGGWTWEDSYTAAKVQPIPEPEELQPGEDSWRDYVRWRYGDEVAEAVGDIADNEDDAITMAKLAALEELENIAKPAEDENDGELNYDLVSENHDDVNTWLAQEYLRRKRESLANSWSCYSRCKLCEVYTKAKDGVCGFCQAQLAKDSEKERAA
jgi:hypothetical protein